MTLIDYATGELVEFDTAAAERRAERITLRLDAIADNYRAVLPLIREAIEKRDDIALGYRSPGDYVSDRFGQSLAGLGVDVRRAVVGELTEAGLSTRAIAPVVGVSHEQVRKDQRGVNQLTPDQTPDSTPGATPPATGAESGQTSTPALSPGTEEADIPQSAQSQGEEAPPSPSEVEQSTGSDVGASATPRPAASTVTGIDGKTYSRPEPKAKPALVGDAADYDNAEQASKALSRAISKLLEFQHPNMRSAMRRYWSMASTEVPPTPRRDVTPEQMRVAAQGLLTLADEWDAR